VAGRPSKRTPEREARLLEALRAGNTRKAACHYAGIEIHTFLNWVNRFSHFSQAVEKAEGDAEVRMVAQIAQAAQTGTWQAAAWWLERRRPDDYGRREKIEITVRQQAEKLAADLGLDPEELIAEAEALLAGNRA
jgi:hypothetical protein